MNKKKTTITRLERDPTQRIIGLMNHFHSLGLRYFASEDLRKKELTATQVAIENLLEGDISDNLRVAVKQSFKNKRYWEEIRSRLG